MPRIIYSAIPDFGADLRDFQVVTPHDPAARALGASQVSLRSIARDISSVNGFRVAGPVEARRMLVQAVATVIGSTREDPKDPRALATRLLIPLQTAMRTGVDVERLREVGSLRARELADVIGQYRSLLRGSDAKGRRLVDDAELLDFASRCEIEPRRIYVHGYFRARPEELRFINTLAADGSVIIWPVHDHAMFATNQIAVEQLVGLGWQVEQPAVVADPTGRRAATRFHGGSADPIDGATASSHADQDAEVRYVLGRVKQLLYDGVSPAAIALVARDARQYGAPVTAVAREYGIGVRLSYSIPLAATRLGNWLLLLLEAAREEWPFESTLRLLVHPFGTALRGANWRGARAEHPSGREAWQKFAPAIAELGWPPKATREQWLEKLADVINTFRLARACGDSSRDLLALERINREFADPFHPTETLYLNEFVEEIAGLLSLLTVPAEPGHGGVELHPPEGVAGARYGHLFILGGADGVLPGPVEDNPVIDFYERRSLAEHGVEFEQAEDVARWEDLAFHFLLETGADRIHLSYPQLLEGKQQLPSVYFGRLGLRPEPIAAASWFSKPEAMVRTIVKDEEVGDVITKAAKHSLRVESGREAAGDYDQYDGVTGIGADALARTWSASQLRNLGQCSFRWFAERALHLSEPDEPDLGLAPDVRGTLYHRVLELALANAPVGIDLREWALGRLDEAFSAAEVDPEVGLPHVPAWAAQRIEHLELLRRAIRSRDFVREGARVVGMEQEFRSYWHGLRVMGYIDRIDRGPDGLILIDYKTGGAIPKGIKDHTGRLSTDVQIPIYIEAAAPVLYPNEPVAGGYYFSISKAKELKKVRAGATSELRTFAEQVKRDLADGYFPVAPDHDFEACTYCEQAIVCRVGHRLTRKTGR
jgi:RecB family exonuclease